MKKYLFICTGNTCRSPMAQGIFNKMAKERGIDAAAKSAGISVSPGMLPAENAVSACKEIGVDISNHRSVMLSNDLFYEADRVVPLNTTHKIILTDAFNDGEKVTEPLGVDDPFGGNLDVYRACRDGQRIRRRCSMYNKRMQPDLRQLSYQYPMDKRHRRIYL